MLSLILTPGRFLNHKDKERSPWELITGSSGSGIWEIKLKMSDYRGKN